MCKNDLRNFENRFFEVKNQIFILSQPIILKCVATCQTHLQVLFLLFCGLYNEVKLHSQSTQNCKWLKHDLINFKNPFFRSKIQIVILCQQMLLECIAICQTYLQELFLIFWSPYIEIKLLYRLHIVANDLKMTSEISKREFWGQTFKVALRVTTSS